MAGNESNATVANAYVQIIPSAQGIKENVTDVVAKQGDVAGRGFTAGFGNALKGVGAALAKVAKVAGAAALAAGTMITKAAVDAYADYEQLTGGIETLYKDSADVVIANAEAAYRTAGMSANDYMETVMQFSGSLLQSVGGDTVKAAQMADMALRDMSDNANKMGVDIERLQDAYRGFARGNYTMLDNLSLGYGGTRQEMERLLKDAEAISGIHYDVSSYADIVDAIHVIQTEMGITGTTALEAASTISGSWGMLQASWDNLLVSLAGGGADIDTAIEQTFDSLITWLGNLLPRIAETVQGIIRALPKVIETAWPAVRDAVMQLITDTFGSDAADAVRDAFNTFHGILERLGEKFDVFKSAIVDNVMPALQNLAEAAKPLIDEIFPVIADVVETVGGVFLDVGTIIANFVAGAINAIAGFLPVVKEKFDAVKNAIREPMEKARDFVRNAIDAIKGFFNFKFQWPHIPLPHFSISGSINPIDWITGGGLPSISVQWYAKGGIIDGASLIGAGEAGPELIWPSASPYLERWASALVSQMDGGGTVNNYYIDGNLVAADAALAAALDTVAQRVNGRARMGTAR